MNINYALYDHSKTLAENAALIGCSERTISKYKKANQFITQKSLAQLQQEYAINPKICVKCPNPVPFLLRRNICCSKACATKNRSLGRVRTDESKAALSLKMKHLFATKKVTPKASIRELNEIPTIVRRTARSYGVTTCPSCATPFNKKKANSIHCSRVCSYKSPKLGGPRPKSGIGKSGTYKGIHCDSTWELAWFIYALDHQIKFERNTTGFPYIFNGKQHLYYPDIKLANNTYIEIKGRNDATWQAKLQQFPHPIKVLYKNDIQPYLDYVLLTYKVLRIQELYDEKRTKKKTCIAPNCTNACLNLYCSKACQGIGHSLYFKRKYECNKSSNCVPKNPTNTSCYI